MTKKVLAVFFKSAIPVIGGVIAGGLIFVTFRPCCERLKDALSDTMLSNPDHKSIEAEDAIYYEIEKEIVELGGVDSGEQNDLSF